MALYRIERLNFMSSGRHRTFLNADVRLGYELSAAAHMVSLEPAEGKEDPLSGDVRLEKQDALLRATLSCCAERRWREISAFNAARLRRGATFVVETVQGDQGMNEARFDGMQAATALPAYDMADVAVKSRFKSRRGRFEKFDKPGDRTEREDVYLPPAGSPVGFCQVGEETYALTPPTLSAPLYLESSLVRDREYSSAGDHYRMSLAAGRLKTALYPSPAELSAGSYAEYFGRAESDAETDEARRRVLGAPRFVEGIRYSYVACMANGDESRKRESDSRFLDGNVYGWFVPTKSMYDATYSTRMEGPLEFRNCREYAGVSQCGGQVYLKYYDSAGYTGSVGADGSAQVRQLPRGKWPYQKIEAFMPVGDATAAGANLHKSSFFSVRLHDTGLAGELSGALAAVKKDICNAIREIAEHAAPANTQLFDVQFAD